MVRVGIDLGDSRIGIAVSDELGIVASPHSVLTSAGWNRDIENIARIVEEVGAGEVVVGLPVNMDGTHGPRAHKATEFAERLRKSLSVPVLLWDERLSTVQATRAMLEADLSRAKRKKAVDKAAASLILQNYLDYVSR
ncbi:MAG: Holliday junction resolvase RuvX [Bacillota bacterium]|nr:Holliday junction resolvase RuvX [Bacillota bacterium]